MTLAYNRHINQLRQQSEQAYQNELNNYNDYHLKHIRVANKKDYQYMTYYKLEEYRSLNDEQANKDRIQNHLEQLLHYCHLRDSLVSMIISMKQGNISLYYGFEVKSHMNIKSQLESCFLDSKLLNMKEKMVYGYSGCICGDYSVFDINNALMTLKDVDGAFIFTMRPTSIDQEKQRLEDLYSEYSIASHINYDHGIGKNYHYQSHHTPTQEYVDLLENKLNYIKNPKERYVLTECFFASNNQKNLEIIGKHLTSHLSLVRDKRINNPLSIIYTDINPLNKIFTTYDCFYTQRINNGFNQLLSIKDASHLLLPPTQSFKGIQVYKQLKTDQDIHTFDITIPKFDKQPHLWIGNVDNQKYLLPKDYVTQHLFISGKPGFGKTTLVKRLIIELNKEGIKPFIIESAKKEYCTLINQIKDLKIYSAGKDGLDLKINVFEVDEGVMVAKHVSSLMGAFMSLFDGESPLPETMTRYINYLYKKHDIKMSDIGDKSMKYPTLEEFLAGIKDFVETHTDYEKKVKGNLSSAIYNRVSSLVEGPAGLILNCDKGMSLKSLMNQCTLVELDDIEEENRDFMTMILTMKINHVLRNLPLSPTLKHVLILEEAHNVLSNTEKIGVKPSKAITSSTYSRLLSEIRAYGIGIIVSDQRPSFISSDVIGQSRTKITFNLDEAKDIETLIMPYNLSMYQQSQVRLLNVGECLVSVSGYKEIVKLKVVPLEKNTDNHFGCLFCNKRCSTKENIQLNNYEKDYILKRIEYLNNQELVNYVNELVKQYHVENPICFLGQMLEQTNLIDTIKRRKLYIYKGGNHNG